MTSATSNSDRVRRPRGFTLTELLTVMGIIIILVGILIPTIIRAYGNADRVRSASDIQAIGVALEAYRADFGDYPRIDRSLFSGPVATPANANGKGTGAALLCKALIGPGGVISSAAVNADDYATGPQWAVGVVYSIGDYVYDATSNMTYVCIASNTATAANEPGLIANVWTQFSMQDSLKGLGGRARVTRSAGADGILGNADDVFTASGKTWGPYLQLDRFKIQGNGTADPGTGLADMDGHVFLYYPAAVSKPSVFPVDALGNPKYTTYLLLLAAGGGYCTDYPGAGKPQPLYCATDNENSMTLTDLQALLGDYSLDGQLEPIDHLATLPASYAEVGVGYLPYLIISPGPDGAYGPSAAVAGCTVANVATQWPKNKAAVAACDDVCNFPR